MIEDIKQVNKQVEWVLKEYPETRDSDKKLILKIWKIFYSLDLSYRQEQIILKAPCPESIRRIRQKFQEGGSFKSGVEMPRKVEEAKVRGELIQGKLI